MCVETRGTFCAISLCVSLPALLAARSTKANTYVHIRTGGRSHGSTYSSQGEGLSIPLGDDGMGSQWVELKSGVGPSFMK